MLNLLYAKLLKKDNQSNLFYIIFRKKIEMVKKRKIKNVVKLTLGIVPLLFIVYLVVGPIFNIIKQDILAENMFVISDYVNVRTNPDEDALRMGKIDYGTEVLVYNIENSWAEVLIEGQKGYIYKEFLGEPKLFYKMDGLFGDDYSKKRLAKLKYRLAVVKYLDSSGYITNIKKEYESKFEDEDLVKERFQIFSAKKGSLYNSTAYSDFDGDFKWDVAVVLKNINTEANHLVVLSFDKNDYSKAIFSMELENNYYFIKRIKKRYRKYMYNDDGEKVKKRIPIAAVEIGTNRNRNLKDTEYLLIYNGEKFELIDQTPPEE